MRLYEELKVLDVVEKKNLIQPFEECELDLECKVVYEVDHSGKGGLFSRGTHLIRP